MTDGRESLPPGASSGDISHILVPRQEIQRRVEELARQIGHLYEGKELTILAVLTGSLIFLADLIRHLPIKMRISLISASSYPGASTRSSGAPLMGDLPAALAGQHVLILDDILDSGCTMAALREKVQAIGPSTLRTCVLVRKFLPGCPARPEPDFVGFEIPDRFVVGYGLDFDHLYRNLPDICVLRQDGETQ